MKTTKALRLNGRIIPAGTNLMFSNEGYTTFKGVRIHKSQIPEAAIESAPASQRHAEAGHKLAKTIRLGDTVIPAGESLHFNAEGIANYKGKDISIYQIPSKAFEGAVAMESQSPVTLKMPVCVNGTVIPANETLMFDANGMAAFEGKQISIYDFPTAAIAGIESMVNNAVDTEKEYKKFEDLEPGDLGIGQDGEAVRFLGKATGTDGYNALVGQFGDASGKTFEDITAGIDDEAIATTQFVAYTIPDGTVCIGIYGADHVVATEADAEQFVPFAEVESGDDAVTADGKKVTVVAKGNGSVWYKKMLEALQLECQMESIGKRLGMEGDDLDKFCANADFIIVINDKNEKTIDLYGANGVKVFKNEE